MFSIDALAADDAASWAPLAQCDDSGDCGTRAVLDTGALDAGENLVLLEGYANNEGAFSLAASCEGACGAGVLDLGGTCGGRLSCGGRLNGTTTTALSIAGGTAGDVFYALSLDHPQSNVVFDTCRANFDDWLRLYRVTDLDYFDDPAADDASGGDDAFSRDDDDYGGGGGGALPRGWTQLFSCDDCGDCANPTRAWLKTGALARDDYLLQIEGWSGHTGDFTLAVECTPSPYDDAPARPTRAPTPHGTRAPIQPFTPNALHDRVANYSLECSADRAPAAACALAGSVGGGHCCGAVDACGGAVEGDTTGMASLVGSSSGEAYFSLSLPYALEPHVLLALAAGRRAPTSTRACACCGATTRTTAAAAATTAAGAAAPATTRRRGRRSRAATTAATA